MPPLNALRQRFGYLTEVARAEKVEADRLHRERYVVPHDGQCILCGTTGLVVWVASMTMYEWTAAQKAAGEPDPNADLELCEMPCRDMHIQEMSDRWAEYHSGLL